MEQIVSSFLLYLKIPISSGYVERLIQSHPNYPSLLSIADIFERLGVQYYVRKLMKDELNSLAFPYLLHLDRGQGELVAIKNERDLKEKQDDFRFWKGTVIQAAPTFHIRDHENNRLYSEEKVSKRILWILITAICGLQSIALLKSFSWPVLSLSLTSVMGLVIGFLLQSKDLGKRFEALEVFCNNSKNMDCDKVLTSNKAKFFGLIKFSDLVLAYFVLQLALLLSMSAVPSYQSPFFTVTLVMSISTLPFIIYSISYQYVQKSACALCLAVDAILLIQVIIFSFSYFQGMYGLAFDSYYVGSMSLLAFVIVVASIQLVKSLISKDSGLHQAAIAATRIKHSTSVFTYLLFQQKKIDTRAFPQEISLGNRNASVRIIMASNLFCNPCKSQHEQAKHLLNTYPDKVLLTIRFVYAKNNPSSLEAVKYFLDSWLRRCNPSDGSTTESLLNNWYALMNLEKFKELFPMESNKLSSCERLATLHSEWVDEAGITETPTFFINGFSLPKGYRIEDLISLIPDLADYFVRDSTAELLDALEV